MEPFGVLGADMTNPPPRILPRVMTDQGRHWCHKSNTDQLQTIIKTSLPQHLNYAIMQYSAAPKAKNCLNFFPHSSEQERNEIKRMKGTENSHCNLAMIVQVLILQLIERAGRYTGRSQLPETSGIPAAAKQKQWPPWIHQVASFLPPPPQPILPPLLSQSGLCLLALRCAVLASMPPRRKAEIGRAHV